MQDECSEPGGLGQAGPRTRTRYVPIEDAHPGARLAQAVLDGYGRSMLPVGVILSEEHLHQLQAHQIEFICVESIETRSPERIAVEAAAAARRVLEKFEHTDLTDPVAAALFNQVLIYRSA